MCLEIQNKNTARKELVEKCQYALLKNVTTRYTSTCWLWVQLPSVQQRSRLTENQEFHIWVLKKIMFPFVILIGFWSKFPHFRSDTKYFTTNRHYWAQFTIESKPQLSNNPNTQLDSFSLTVVIGLTKKVVEVSQPKMDREMEKNKRQQSHDLETGLFNQIV